MTYLVKASDPTLRSRAAHELIDELLGGEDRTLVVEEFTVPSKTRGRGGRRRAADRRRRARPRGLGDRERGARAHRS